MMVFFFLMGLLSSNLIELLSSLSHVIDAFGYASVFLCISLTGIIELKREQGIQM